MLAPFTPGSLAALMVSRFDLVLPVPTQSQVTTNSFGCLKQGSLLLSVIMGNLKLRHGAGRPLHDETRLSLFVVMPLTGQERIVEPGPTPSFRPCVFSP
jgi:hypothetical protein